MELLVAVALVAAVAVEPEAEPAVAVVAVVELVVGLVVAVVSYCPSVPSFKIILLSYLLNIFHRQAQSAALVDTG